METNHSVMQFRARCDACGKTFPYPLLSDFQSYGEFILESERGGRYAYLNSFAEPAWDVIAAMLPPTSEHDGDYAGPAVDRLQRIIAACADPVAGERLTTGPPICPSCQSRNVTYSDAEPMGPIVLPIVSYSRFMSMAAEQRRLEVATLLQREPPLGAPIRLPRQTFLVRIFGWIAARLPN